MGSESSRSWASLRVKALPPNSNIRADSSTPPRTRLTVVVLAPMSMKMPPRSSTSGLEATLATAYGSATVSRSSRSSAWAISSTAEMWSSAVKVLNTVSSSFWPW